MALLNNTIDVYTDGSCHTQLCVGAWASILLFDNQKIIISDVAENTTHNRMEILAVIKALDYIHQNLDILSSIKIISDSQYVVGLLDRRQKFILNNYKTKAGNDIRNKDLVLNLFKLVDILNVIFIKIKAHQKPTDTINYNIDVDKICRSLVRGFLN